MGHAHTIAYDWDALATELATHTAWDMSPSRQPDDPAPNTATAPKLSSPVADGGGGPRSGSEGVPSPSLAEASDTISFAEASDKDSGSSPPDPRSPIPDPPLGPPSLAQASDSIHALLHDLADPSLSLADLTHIHRAPVSALRAIPQSPEFQQAAADYHALAHLREQLVNAASRTAAAAALADCAQHAPNPETRRKAATRLADFTRGEPRPPTAAVRKPNPEPRRTPSGNAPASPPAACPDRVTSPRATPETRVTPRVSHQSARPFKYNTGCNTPERRCVMKASAGLTACLAIVAGTATVFAGDVDIRKNRDSHVTVWRTLLGFRVGDPVYDGTLPEGHRLRVRSHWLTDLSVTQDLPTVAAHTQHDMAALIGPPGMVTMAPLDDWVRDAWGDEAGTVIDFAPGLAPSAPELYVAIDLTRIDPWKWTCPGELFFVINGEVLGLPGYAFSHVPFEYIDGEGWINLAPFNGEIEAIGEMTLNASPYPPNGCNLADLNGDFILDLSDVNLFVSEFLAGCPAP